MWQRRWERLHQLQAWLRQAALAGVTVVMEAEAVAASTARRMGCAAGGTANSSAITGGSWPP